MVRAPMPNREAVCDCFLRRLAGTPLRGAAAAGFGIGGGAVALDNPLAEGFVGGVHGVNVNCKCVLAGVLGDEFEAELKILEAQGAEFAHGQALLQGEGDQAVGGGVGEADAQLVVLAEAQGEIMGQLARDDALLVFVLGQELLQIGGGIVHQFAGDDEAADFGGGQLEFEVAEDAFADGHQAARAGGFGGGQFGDAAQAVVAKEDFDAVGGEGLLVLADDAALGGFEDGEQVFGGERLANDADGEASDELRLESEINEIAGLGLLEPGGVFAGNGLGWRR